MSGRSPYMPYGYNDPRSAHGARKGITFVDQKEIRKIKRGEYDLLPEDYPNTYFHYLPSAHAEEPGVPVSLKCYEEYVALDKAEREIEAQKTAEANEEDFRITGSHDSSYGTSASHSISPYGSRSASLYGSSFIPVSHETAPYGSSYAPTSHAAGPYGSYAADPYESTSYGSSYAPTSHRPTPHNSYTTNSYGPSYAPTSHGPTPHNSYATNSYGPSYAADPYESRSAAIPYGSSSYNDSRRTPTSREYPKRDHVEEYSKTENKNNDVLKSISFRGKEFKSVDEKTKKSKKY